MSTHRFSSPRPLACAKLGVVTALLACAGCTMAQGGGDPTSENPSTNENTLATPTSTTVSILGTTQTTDGVPLDGVDVCLHPGPSGPEDKICTTSDASGAWEIATAPSRTFVGIAFSKDGYFPVLNAITTGTSDLTMPAGDGTLIPAR